MKDFKRLKKIAILWCDTEIVLPIMKHFCFQQHWKKLSTFYILHIKCQETGSELLRLCKLA